MAKLKIQKTKIKIPRGQPLKLKPGQIHKTKKIYNRRREKIKLKSLNYY